MYFAPRKLLASVTAAAVLLCSVLCACGGSLPHFDVKAVATLPAATVERQEHKHHCHGHGTEGQAGHGKEEGKEEAPSEDAGQKPEPCHDGAHPCSHCESAAIVSEAGKHMADRNPPSQFDGTFLPAAFAVPAFVSSPVRWPGPGDLSPPPTPTLLSLHCALNT